MFCNEGFTTSLHYTITNSSNILPIIVQVNLVAVHSVVGYSNGSSPRWANLIFTTLQHSLDYFKTNLVACQGVKLCFQTQPHFVLNENPTILNQDVHFITINGFCYQFFKLNPLKIVYEHHNSPPERPVLFFLPIVEVCQPVHSLRRHTTEHPPYWKTSHTTRFCSLSLHTNSLPFHKLYILFSLDAFNLHSISFQIFQSILRPVFMPIHYPTYTRRDKFDSTRKTRSVTNEHYSTFSGFVTIPKFLEASVFCMSYCW